MQHFLLISHSLDVLPLLYAVSNHPYLWNQDRLRTGHPGSVHKDVSDVLLHFQPPGTEFKEARNSHDCEPRPAWWALPEARALVFGLMARIQGTRLGRVMLTRLPAGKSIPPHTDSDSQTKYYRRHHITLCSPQECQFVIDDEVLSLQPGTCWWVNNGAEHTVINDGPTDRIALIIDVHVPQLGDVHAPRQKPRR